MVKGKIFKLALIGASGLVGETVLSVIKEEGLDELFEIRLFVSEKSAGRTMTFDGREYQLFELNSSSVNSHFDVAIFSAGDEVSRVWADYFAERGAYVIDNSNAFRRVDGVPLVVPEINGDIITASDRIIANPNCSTIQLVLVLNRLRSLSKIKKVVVSSYQSVSGAGRAAVMDLDSGDKSQIKEGIRDNIIAKIGDILPGGFSVEEDKIMFETNKILNDSISVCATAVRVPIKYCHGESVLVEFEGEVSASEALGVLQSKELVCSADKIFLPTGCAGQNKTQVFRLRNFGGSELAMFILADNLRRGAAYNAIEILKIILKKYLL